MSDGPDGTSIMVGILLGVIIILGIVWSHQEFEINTAIKEATTCIAAGGHLVYRDLNGNDCLEGPVPKVITPVTTK